MRNGVYLLQNLEAVAAHEPRILTLVLAQYVNENQPEPWVIGEDGSLLSENTVNSLFNVVGRLIEGRPDVHPEGLCCSNPDVMPIGVPDGTTSISWCRNCGTLDRVVMVDGTWHLDMAGTYQLQPAKVTEPIDFRVVPTIFANGFYYVYDRIDRRYTIAERSTVTPDGTLSPTGSRAMWQILGMDNYIFGDEPFRRRYVVYNPVGLAA